VQARGKLVGFGFWVSFALLLIAFSAPLFWIGGRETIVEINPSGLFLIVSVTIVSALSAIAWLIRASRSGSVESTLVLLRKLRPAAWWLRILGIVGAITVLVALFAWMWVQVLIRLSPGVLTLANGEVVGFSRTGIENLSCQYLVDVKLSQDRKLKICAEFGLVVRTIPSELRTLEKGDAVRIGIRATALGKTAAIVGRQAS
jgi:hypothetical protein